MITKELVILQENIYKKNFQKAYFAKTTVVAFVNRLKSYNYRSVVVAFQEKSL